MSEEELKENKIILQSLRYVLHRIVGHPQSGARKIFVRKNVDDLIEKFKEKVKNSMETQKILSQRRDSKWVEVKEWITKSGLKARIHQCIWNRDLMPILSLHDHYCGYVQVPEGKNFGNGEKLNAHGGITFSQGKLIGCEEGEWIGFDMAHLGDENIVIPLEYCVEECESLADQIKSKQI